LRDTAPPVTVRGTCPPPTPTSPPPTTASTYSYAATFPADGNNAKAPTGCKDEPVVVGQATPTIETSQEPPSGTVGATFKDKATLGGLFGAHPTGNSSRKLDNNSSYTNAEGGLIASDGPSD